MYLKKIELKGFKSFPNKTDILFKNGITSIVGPNGSGKSNVSDAVRWVLGEQSMKSLRGEKLEDVIFVGSDMKKAMGYCEVALTIDNKEDILDIEYSEVTIKRRAYKSGESEFYINNKACRLKDIKELLLDTGIGREGYSVIEQGKIDEILSSNAGNRRKVFDEACGISKYRYKKEEGEKKLKAAKENLDRINDIFCEIENQVKPLEIQKNKSLKYIDLREKLKILETNNYIREIEVLDTHLKEINSHKKILEEQLKDLQEKKEAEENRIVHLQSNLDKLETRMNEGNENIHKLKIEIDHKDGDLNLLQEKVKNINNNKERKEKEIKGLEEAIEKNEREGEKGVAEKNALEIRLENLKQEGKVIQDKTKEQNEAVKLKEEKIESLKDEIIRLLDEKNKKNARFSSFNTTLENIKNRQATIERELEELQIKIKTKNEELEKDLLFKKNTKEKIEAFILKKENQIKKLHDLKTDLKNIEIDITSKNLKINEYKSKLNIYYEMEKQYEGFNKGVKEILKNKNLGGILGAVAEIIKVPKQYEIAIEVALGASLQNIITEDENKAKIAIDYLKKNNSGRVTFLPLNIIKGKKINANEIPKVKGFLGTASDMIEYSLKFKNIMEYNLGRTVLVENIEAAIELGKKTNHKYKIVTLEGEIFNAGGSLTGGSVKTVNNLLSRKRVIEEFEEEIENLKMQLENLLNKRKELETDIECKNEEVMHVETSLQNEEKINLSLDSNIHKVNEEIKTLKDAVLKLQKEEKGLKENLEYTQNNINFLNEEMNKLENENLSIEKIIKDMGVEKEENKEKYERDIEILNNINLNIAKFSQVYENLKKEIERMDKEIEHLKASLIEKREEMKNDALQKEDLGEKSILLRVEKEELKEKLKDIEEKFEKYKKEKTSLLQNLKTKQGELKNLEEKYLELKESIYKLDGKIDKLENTQNNYFNKLWEEYEMTYYDALKLRKEDLVIEKKEIERIKLDIKKLGHVNLDSIEKYKEVKERYDFYKEQKEDLEKSIESIEKLIKDMESTMKFEFSKNFEKINENFIQVYKKLFGGGCGELKILDYSNLLGSDIEIIAQPPGKKLKNINLLSGGEKALTAICVLFAILLTKPTPFCILDEIEAPLDDANIYRYGAFLKELSKETQFITITHRRGTMEASDYIYGVTMEEKGISKVVSLKLEEARNLSEENIS